MEPINYACSIWPKGFTKPEIEEALGHPVSIMAMISLRAIENTGVRRKHGNVRYVVWRFRPYQLNLPLEVDDGREASR